jgi:hypothetical protein
MFSQNITIFAVIFSSLGYSGLQEAGIPGAKVQSSQGI